jgi:hypothetical protein
MHGDLLARDLVLVVKMSPFLDNVGSLSRGPAGATVDFYPIWSLLEDAIGLKNSFGPEEGIFLMVYWIAVGARLVQPHPVLLDVTGALKIGQEKARVAWGGWEDVRSLAGESLDHSLLRCHVTRL